MADVDSDVKINVGAEAKLDGATQQILAEFSQVEERLVRIGTAEANALAKQLKAAASGLTKGILSADDVDNVAMAFSGITKDAQLTDSAISDLATSFSDAVDNSRALSDWMRKSAESGEEAKASLSEMLGEFSKMEERLTRIGTADAKALAKQLKEATRGLSKGAFDPKEIDAVAQSFAGIKEDAQLTDQVISDISSKLSDAQKNSRGLSDWMNKSGRYGGGLRGAFDKISSALDKMSPKASEFSAHIGRWAQKIPGVSNLIGRMPLLAGGIGIAFKAATAAILAAGDAMKKYQATMREIQARNRKFAEVDAANDATNAGNAIDNRLTKIKQETEAKKAIMNAERELYELEEKEKLYDKQATTANAQTRTFQETQTQRDIEKRQLEDRKKIVEDEIALIQKEREAMEEKLKNDELTLTVTSANIKEEEKLLAQYEELRGEAYKVAERQAKEGGILENSDGWLDAVNQYASENLKAKFMDMGSNVKRMFANALGFKGNDLNTEEAQEEWLRGMTEMRRRRQERKQMEDSVAKQKLAIEAMKDKEAEKIKSKDVLEKQESVRVGRINAEEAARKQEIDERIANRRVELMGAGNRLTAMGLGGGNAVVDSGKKIASNTDEIKQILKDYVRQGIKLAPGQHMSGRADTSPIANYNPLVWPK